MEKLIIITIWPASVVLTAFMFNIATQELIDVRYGLNKYYFKPIATIAILIYLIYALPGLVIVEATKTSEIKINARIIVTTVIMLILARIYYIIFHKFNNKKKEIFKASKQYKPDKIKSEKLKQKSLILIGISSLLTFLASYPNINLVMDTLKNGFVSNEYSLIALVFLILFLCYAITITAAGYVYNYGQLFDFEKYRLIITNEFKEMLDIMGIKINKKFIDAYILVESEENMTIKIDGIDHPSITIKKEDILNISFIDENQTIIQEGSINEELHRREEPETEADLCMGQKDNTKTYQISVKEIKGP